MARRDRIIFFSAAILLCVLAACGRKKDVEYAKRSVYDTDFANVYNAALNATRELYPKLNENPGPGKISTAWHQVSYGNNQDDLSNQRMLRQSQGLQPGVGASAGQRMAGVPTRLAYKRYFIRFDVSVLGGRPWRVKVVGHASEWEPGNAMPTEMRGANRPSWLDGRTEALQVAIYRRLKTVAVPMKEEEQVAEEIVPRTDPTSFKDVPAGAAKALAQIKDSLAKRDYVALRPLLDDDVVWSLGGGTGADIAIATWQADPSSFEAMEAAIVAGCGAADDGAKRVACPPGAPLPGVYQLVLEERAGGAWKVTSFVKAE